MNCQRQPAANWQAVAERTGGQLDAGHVMADVPRQGRTVLAVRQEIRDRKEAALGEHRVEDGGAVPLADDQAIARGPIRTFGINAQT